MDSHQSSNSNMDNGVHRRRNAATMREVHQMRLSHDQIIESKREEYEQEQQDYLRGIRDLEQEEIIRLRLQQRARLQEEMQQLHEEQEAELRQIMEGQRAVIAQMEEDVAVEEQDEEIDVVGFESDDEVDVVDSDDEVVESDDYNVEEAAYEEVSVAADAAVTAVRQRICKLQKENEECSKLGPSFSRQCNICYCDSPLQRAVFSKCGHVICLACAEQIKAVAMDKED